MKNLRPIGTIAGIRVRVHPLTLALPVGVLAYGLWAGLGGPGLAWLMGFVVAVMGCVVLHELGHAAAARFFGVGVHDILILPIGGAVRLERPPPTPAREAAVVFAGPLVNLLLAAGFAPALLHADGGPTYLWEGALSWRGALASLATFNFLVFAINLVPAFPLDGGRLLRAVLTNWTTRLRATKVVVAIARLLMLGGMAWVTYHGHYFSGAFLLYLFVTAGREVHLASVQHFLEVGRLGDFALPVRVFDPAVPVAEVVRQLERNEQRGAVVADECSPIGFVTLDHLRAALDPARPERPVGDLEMLTVVCHDPEASLRQLSHQFACHPHSVAVEEIDGRPAGYLDVEQLGVAFERFTGGADGRS